MLKFKQSEREPFRLDLVPMINVVFLLLIFFMLTSTASKSRMQVDLPEAKSANEIEKERIVLVISKTGALELEGVPILSEDLLEEFKKQFSAEQKKTVEIQADKNIEFGLFGKIIGMAREAGAEDFIFATEHTPNKNI
jgi:biopolymer transport protein ExbD